jgi:hypothetical protein
MATAKCRYAHALDSLSTARHLLTRYCVSCSIQLTISAVWASLLQPAAVCCLLITWHQASDAILQLAAYIPAGHTEQDTPSQLNA